MEEKQINNDCVRDFIDAADVKNIFLYRKDGYILSYLRIFSYNLNLKSQEERRVETDRLTAKFKNNRKDFTYFTLPRELDLDNYKDLLKDKYNQSMNIGHRHIIAAMMGQCADITTDGRNYEHQHFIRIWEKRDDPAKAEAELKERITDFKIRYQEAEINCKILEERDIIKLCNLYGNALQASYENVEETSSYTPIMQM